MQKNNHYFNTIFKKLNWEEKYYDVLLYVVNNMVYNHTGKNKRNTKLFSKRGLFVLLARFSRFIPVFLFKKRKSDNINIISNAYVKLEFNNYLFHTPPWFPNLISSAKRNKKLELIVKQIEKVISKKNLNLLLSNSFRDLLYIYEKEFLIFLKNNKVKAIIVPNDMSFFENFSIKIAQSINIKTFVYLHGLPVRYNSIDDNRADYLIVWGKGLKDTYVSSGVNKQKILSLKHPIYSNWSDNNLRSDITNILVLTKSIPTIPMSSDSLVLGDYSKTLLYVEEVKSKLKELGVQRAMLRLHPSESLEYYKDNLIDDFFQFDLNSKENSLNQATLVIGPSSTMVLDAIKSGVNYILFDPKIDGLLIDNQETLYPPFDGSSFIKLSKDTEDFKRNIEHPEENIDFDKLSDFFSVEHEDLNFLNTLLDN